MTADQIAASAQTRPASGGLNRRLTDPLIIAGVVLAAALLGIALRPVGFLSAFWPANAMLLGLLVRYPRLATPLGWTAATAAFLVADLATGSSWTKALVLTAGNLAGVVTGFLLLMRLHPDDRALTRPSSVIAVTVVLAVASVAVGVVGAAGHPLLFKRPPSMGVFFFWAATELANYMVILPVLLTASRLRAPAGWLAGPRRARAGVVKAAPLLAYVLSLALTPLVGGPGALAFPVPALLWCAVVYGLAGAAWLNLAFAVWTLLVLGTHAAAFGLALEGPMDTISLRLGVLLIALGPIMVASLMAARDTLLREATLARKAAEEAMAARTLLLATMAHELRSPLTSVVGFSSLMAKQAFGPIGSPKYLDYAQSIELAGSHLSDLVTDLLDTAKLEAGKVELVLARIASREVVDQSLRLVRGLAMETGVSVAIAPGDWPDVQADSRAVKQVLINLLSNAIKFSAPGSAVTVSCGIGDGRLTIQVTDRGRGIPREDLAVVGRAYAQAGDVETRRQGTGLGLALSAELVRQHGGRLRLDSTLGVGTCVSFDLPLADPGGPGGG